MATCTCKGFHQPPDCPEHGRSGGEKLAEELILGFAPKLDATPLAKFDTWKEEMTSLDLASGPDLMRRFLQAFEWTSKAVVGIRKRLAEATETMRHEEAKAKLERFADYYAANKDKLGGLRDSSSLREMYLPLDEQYSKAVEKVNMLKALVKFLENKADSYRMAHDDAKKIYSSLLMPSGNGSHGIPGGSNGDIRY